MWVERPEVRDGSNYIERLVPEKPHLRTHTPNSTSPLNLRAHTHLGKEPRSHNKTFSDCKEPCPSSSLNTPMVFQSPCCWKQTYPHSLLNRSNLYLIGAIYILTNLQARVSLLFAQYVPFTHIWVISKIGHFQKSSLNLCSASRSMHFSVCLPCFSLGFWYDWVPYSVITVVYSIMDLLMLCNYFPQINILLGRRRKAGGPKKLMWLKRLKKLSNLQKSGSSQSYESAGFLWSLESTNDFSVKLPANIGQQVTRIQSTWAVIHSWASRCSKLLMFQ